MNLVGLFIIFGWPKKTKHLGRIVPAHCLNCDNQTWHDLWKTRRWATIFFIPVFPLSSAEYLVTCNVCGFADEVGLDEVDRCKEMCQHTDDLAQNKISSLEYSNLAEGFLRQSAVFGAASQSLLSNVDVAQATLEQPNADVDRTARSSESVGSMQTIDCPECATPTDATHLHCPECGSELR
jgi:hypothetical protein